MVVLSNEQVLQLAQNTSNLRHIAIVGHPDAGRETASDCIFSDVGVIQATYHEDRRYCDTRDAEPVPRIKAPQSPVLSRSTNGFR